MTIFEASVKGNVEEVKRFLEKGEDINAQNRFGWTPLFFACEEDHLILVEFLLREGANITISNSVGWTAFMCACARGHFKITKLLLKHGANPNDKTCSNLSALQVALASENPQTILLFHSYFHLLEEEDKMNLRKQTYRYSLIS